MKVLLFGADGNMGLRYRAILRHLKHEVVPLELGYDQMTLRRTLKGIEKVIIASATPAHFDNLLDILCARIPGGGPTLDVLCEKPVVQTVERAEMLRSQAMAKNVRLYCVCQYRYLPEARDFEADPHGTGEPTYYNYFRHGKDGLAWDCFQVIGLATGKIDLLETSPVWDCAINGWVIDPGEMDEAYVRMVRDFMGEKLRLWNADDIVRVTEKVVEWSAQHQS